MRKLRTAPMAFALMAAVMLMPIPGRADFTTAAPDACSSTLNSPIKNFCEVSKGTLWRGAKPDEQGKCQIVE